MPRRASSRRRIPPGRASSGNHVGSRGSSNLAACRSGAGARSRCDRSRALARKAQAVYAELGKELGVDDSSKGAGTDAAFAALSGKPAVVENFGLQGFNYHSSEAEFVELDSIEPRLYLLARMNMEASRE